MSHFYDERVVTIAVILLRSQNSQTVRTLKDLLTFIPNPNHANTVLATAIVQLIDTCPESTLWLLQHSSILEPDVQVKQIIAAELKRKLLFWGYTPEDFELTADCQIDMREAAKENLLNHQLASDDQQVATLIFSLLK